MGIARRGLWLSVGAAFAACGGRSGLVDDYDVSPLTPSAGSGGASAWGGGGSGGKRPQVPGGAPAIGGAHGLGGSPSTGGGASGRAGAAAGGQPDWDGGSAGAPSDSGAGGGGATSCGDFFVDRALGEECDDGNTVNGDGCSRDCRRCVVPASYGTIQRALDAGCSTIRVTAGNYEDPIVIDRDVRIVGDGAFPPSVYLGGKLQFRVVTITSGNVQLESVMIRGGRAVADSSSPDVKASGILNQGGELQLVSSIVDGNSSSGTIVRGAGIYSTGDVVLDGTLVTGNVAQADAPDATLERTAMGAGVYIEGARLLLRNAAQIAANYAQIAFSNGANVASRGTARGGGVFALRGNVTLDSESRISSNFARTSDNSTGWDVESAGGGLFLEDGNLTATNALFEENHAEVKATQGRARGGALHALGRSEIRLGPNVVLSSNGASTYTSTLDRATAAGGAIYLASAGELSLLETTMASNSVSSYSSGTDGSALGAGIAIEQSTDNSSVLFRVVRSRLQHNLAVAGSSCIGGGVSVTISGARAGFQGSVEESTALGNRCSILGQGVDSLGGFLSLVAAGESALGTLRITNSTLTENAFATNGGMGARGSALFVSASVPTSLAHVDLNNVTVAYNASDSEGSTLAVDGNASISLRNTLIAQNSSTPLLDCSLSGAGVIESLGYNLYDAQKCAPSGQTSLDIVSASPDLLLSAFNGGFGETHALASTSAAIDAGDPNGCKDDLGTLLGNDQRGFPRDARCDIGAFEFQK